MNIVNIMWFLAGVITYVVLNEIILYMDRKTEQNNLSLNQKKIKELEEKIKNATPQEMENIVQSLNTNRITFINKATGKINKYENKKTNKNKILDKVNKHVN